MQHSLGKGAADLIREIRSKLWTNPIPHEYLAINVSLQAISNQVFYLSKSIFNPDEGITYRAVTHFLTLVPLISQNTSRIQQKRRYWSQKEGAEE